MGRNRHDDQFDFFRESPLGRRRRYDNPIQFLDQSFGKELFNLFRELFFQKFFFCKLFFREFFFCKLFFREFFQRRFTFLSERIHDQLQDIGYNRILRNNFGFCIFIFRNE